MVVDAAREVAGRVSWRRPHRENRVVHYFFDESGDFAFPSDRFDAYTQAAVICPDSRLGEVESFVKERCERWQVEELHAADLSPANRMRVCRYIAESDLQLVAQAT